MKRCITLWLVLLPLAAHANEPGVNPVEVDEPANTRDRPVAPAGFFSTKDHGPVLRLGYRTFSVSEMGGRSSRYHLGTLHVYLFSRLFRAGLGLEGGPESSHRSNFVLDGMLSVGAQYPAGITPFIEAELGLGFLRRDVLEQDLFELAYHTGVEGGVEIYLHPSLLLSCSMGWRRQVFRFGDTEQVQPTFIYFDSLLLFVGFGI